MKTRVQHVNPLRVTQKVEEATPYTENESANAVRDVLNSITTRIYLTGTNSSIETVGDVTDGMNWFVASLKNSKGRHTGYVVMSDDKGGSAGTAGVPVYFRSRF
jgi:hypothetical protein